MVRFWWPWTHFQGHTSILNVIFWPKNLVCILSLEPNDGFWPNFIYCIIGMIKELIKFWWLWPNFQGHHTIKLYCSNFRIITTIFGCPNLAFLQYFLHQRIVAFQIVVCLIMSPNQKGGGTYCFWCTSHQRCSLSSLYPLNQSMDFDQTYTDTLLGGSKEVIRFWWPWPPFQGHTNFEIFKLWPKKACLHPISWTKWRIMDKLHIL